MELEKEELTKTWRGLDVPAYETVGEDGPTRRHPMKPREIGVNRDGNETVVFISGFPDVHGMFDDVIADLKVKHRCVEMITPFMDEPNRNQFFGNQAKPWPPRTLSIDDVVGLTEQVIDRVLETDQGEQVSIICHDFGVVWATGAVHRNPEKFKRCVILDVAPNLPGDSQSLGATLCGLTYQIPFFMFYLVGRRSPTLSNCCLKSFLCCFPVCGMGPLPPSTKWARNYQEIKPYMLWPYWSVFGRAPENLPRIGKDILAVPECPILFMYGKNKRVNFHTKKFLNHLEMREDGSKVIGLNASHWVTEDDPRGTTDAIIEFFSLTR